MRRILLLASAATGLAAAVACATSDVDVTAPPPNDAGPTEMPDAAVEPPAEDAGDAEAPSVEACSDAGWCTTSLPDPDLTLTDIWPFETRAFAIAETPTQGVKVLEWDDAVQTWVYIDDDTQNTFESGRYSGKIWAPNENELYYGVSPAFIYHGTRTAPSSPWTWQRSRLDNHSPDAGADRDPGIARVGPVFGSTALPTDYPALGVWGTSSDDVYAWYANTIFHRTTAGGGEPTWVAEYTADDSVSASDRFFFFSATGSSRDDVWFAGTRGRYANTGVFSCPIVVHKTADGYQRLVDHTLSGTSPTNHTQGSCAAKAGARSLETWSSGFDLGWLVIPPGFMTATDGAWLTNIASAGPNAIAGILEGRNLAYIEASDGGIARRTTMGWTALRRDAPSYLNSVWVHGTETWMSGWGAVLRTDTDVDLWSRALQLYYVTNAGISPDAGTYTVSSLALNGAPLDAPFHQVRGTSNTNLWAVGARYALHKTTP